MSIDSTPLFIEIFKTRAYLKTVAHLILTDEQKKEFDENYKKNLAKVMKESIEQFPSYFKDVDILKEELDKLT
jgi:hypothetical protein